MDTVGTAEWTWVLHSSLLIAAIYCRFARIWSVRNLDLLLLIGLTPALFLYESVPWMLLALSGVLVARLIFDCRFMRRPRIEPNLNSKGLGFLCTAAFIVLMVRVFTVAPTSNLDLVREGEQVLKRQVTDEAPQRPAATIVAAGARVIAENIASDKPANSQDDEAVAPEVEAKQEAIDAAETERLTVRIVTVVAHSLVVGGLLAIGYLHFSSLSIGLSMAALYLLLPCTAFYVHKVNHALPAALLVWALAAHRKPIASGVLLGLSCGALFSTVFLVPLWCVYYGKKRLPRFGTGMLIAAALLAWPLIMTSSANSVGHKFLASMNWSLFNLLDPETYRSANKLSDLLRLPFMVVFGCIFVTLTIWPRQKDLSHLIAHSTVLVVLAQLWYPAETGIYVLWYLPLVLLVVFRPRLRRPVVETDASSSERSNLTRADQPSRTPSGTLARSTMYR